MEIYGHFSWVTSSETLERSAGRSRGMHTEADLSCAESENAGSTLLKTKFGQNCGEGWDGVWFRLRAEKQKQISEDLLLQRS